MKKTYLHLLIFQPVDVDYWFPIYGKTNHRLASKLLISFSVPKNHKINAVGSHLYRKMIFGDRYQPVDVDYWFPIYGKTHHRLASKLLISFSVPKNHKINAVGSHLYRKMIFGFARKTNIFLLQHYHPIRHIHCQIAASEFLTDFDSWDMLTIIGSRSAIPAPFSCPFKLYIF